LPSTGVKRAKKPKKTNRMVTFVTELTVLTYTSISMLAPRLGLEKSDAAWCRDRSGGAGWLDVHQIRGDRELGITERIALFDLEVHTLYIAQVAQPYRNADAKMTLGASAAAPSSMPMRCTLLVAGDPPSGHGPHPATRPRPAIPAPCTIWRRLQRCGILAAPSATRLAPVWHGAGMASRATESAACLVGWRITCPA
jgi:hypothetical protein